MILLGLLPKIAEIVANIPSAVLGGAALVMFGTVAAVGIQTLTRVDFHDDRNVLIVAVSLGFAIIPVAFPTFFHRFGSDVQTIVGSGITMGAFWPSCSTCSSTSRAARETSWRRSIRRCDGTRC